MTDERLEQLLGGCHELSKVIIRERIAGLERELAETKADLKAAKEETKKFVDIANQNAHERNQACAKLKTAVRRFEQLKEYSACEGRPDGDKLLNGLCRAGCMVACADPKYEMYEGYESVEKWLKAYADEALAAIRSDAKEDE